MKKNILFYLFILNTFLLIAQSNKIKGNKTVETNTTDVSEFTILEIGEKFDVTLVESTTPRVFVETDSNLQEYISIKVDAGKLSIRTTREISKFKKMAIEIAYTPKLAKIILRDKVSLETKNTVNVEDLAIEAYSNSKLQLKVKANRIDILTKNDANVTIEANAEEVMGIHSDDSSKVTAIVTTENLNIVQNQQSKLKIEGTAKENSLSLLDSSNFYGTGLVAMNCTANIEGKSDVYLNVTDKASLKLSNSSQTSLLGNPVIDLQNFADQAVLKKIQKAPGTFKRLFN